MLPSELGLMFDAMNDFNLTQGSNETAMYLSAIQAGACTAYTCYMHTSKSSRVLEVHTVFVCSVSQVRRPYDT